MLIRAQHDPETENVQIVRQRIKTFMEVINENKLSQNLKYILMILMHKGLIVFECFCGYLFFDNNNATISR